MYTFFNGSIERPDLLKNISFNVGRYRELILDIFVASIQQTICCSKRPFIKLLLLLITK